MDQMDSRIALISGAAGGIGRALADGFAAAGYAVTGVDRQCPSGDFIRTLLNGL